jgi:DNA-directed RNA polymerase specialized sigma24 family protein
VTASRPERRPPPPDGLLVRAFAQGDERALESLLEHHLPAIYGLLRMVLPTGDEAEAALSDTFCAAAERASDPLARANVREWLATIALEQVELRARPRPPSSLEERRNRRSRAEDEELAEFGLDSLAGISDTALAVIIRTLNLHERQALVLCSIWGLDATRAAGIIGRSAWEVERLTRSALCGVARQVAKHERREAELKRQIEAVPYKLRPLPVGKVGRGPEGSTEVVGTRVHFAPPPQMNILTLIRRAAKRLAELFRRHQAELKSPDETGDSATANKLDPTPSTRPLDKPESTPTTRGYRTPKLTPGVSVYAMPRSTPTTRRLSNRNRPLPPTGR